MLLTRQRKTIIRELKKLKSHPTADEFYELIRKKTPKVSMASIYRNLEVLSQTGHIMKIESCGCQMRFDGETNPHHHLRCLKCGRISDFMPDGAKLLDSSLEEMKKLNSCVCGYRIEFTGTCCKCG